MSFWTKEEFEQFLTAVEHKPDAYMAFKLLFWTGMRVGEMLALQFDDIDTENRIITISKTLVRLKGKDIAQQFQDGEVTLSKEGLEEMQEDYINMIKAITWLLDGAKYLWMNEKE